MSDDLQVTITPSLGKPTTTVQLSDSTMQRTTNYVTYTLSFSGIYEISSDGNTVQSFSLQDSKFVIQSSGSSHTYTTTLSNGAKVQMLIGVYGSATNISFAGHTIKVGASYMKYSMKVSNWPFRTPLANSLRVTMGTPGLPANGSMGCHNIVTGYDMSNNLRWMQSTVNGVVLYGKFMEYAVIDSSSNKTVKYNYNLDSSLIEINIPYFWTSAEFDPEFKVMAKATDLGCSGGSDTGSAVISNPSSGSNTGATVGGILGGIIGAALIGAAVFFLVRHQRRANKAKSTLPSNQGEHGVYTATHLPAPAPPNYGTLQQPPKGKAAVNTSPIYAENEKGNPLFANEQAQDNDYL
jgi:hypothetical protein